MSALLPLTLVAIATTFPGQEKVLRAELEKLEAETAKESDYPR
jgi:hypothetical protein